MIDFKFARVWCCGLMGITGSGISCGFLLLHCGFLVMVEGGLITYCVVTCYTC